MKYMYVNNSVSGATNIDEATNPGDIRSPITETKGFKIGDTIISYCYQTPEELRDKLFNITGFLTENYAFIEHNGRNIAISLEWWIHSRPETKPGNVGIWFDIFDAPRYEGLDTQFDFHGNIEQAVESVKVGWHKGIEKEVIATHLIDGGEKRRIYYKLWNGLKTFYNPSPVGVELNIFTDGTTDLYSCTDLYPDNKKDSRPLSDRESRYKQKQYAIEREKKEQERLKDIDQKTKGQELGEAINKSFGNGLNKCGVW